MRDGAIAIVSVPDIQGVWMMDDQNAEMGVVKAICECGKELIVNRSAYDGTGTVLCRDCEIAQQDALRDERPSSLAILDQTLAEMSFPSVLALGMVASARRSLEGLCEDLRPHNPRIIVAAAELLFWTVHAVRAGKLTKIDSEAVLIDTANMVHLLADELVICTSIIAHLRSGKMEALWPIAERAAISAWVQTRVYVVNEEQLRGLSCGFSPYDPRFRMLREAVTDEDNVS
jgi:hypothetical protein